jgi:thiosulfate/3-mercaptopyruvate sulfurtransferase
MESLVSTEWLELNMRKENIKVVEASFSSKLNSFEDAFLKERIPGAVFFDINKIADPSSKLPRTVPSPEFFETSMQNLGLNDSDDIVLYDRSSQFIASARAWWMFRLFGHDKVYVLNGGFLKWVQEKRPIESGPIPTTLKSGNFKVHYRPQLKKSLSEMINHIKEKEQQIIDSRPPQSFLGLEQPECTGVRPGHMPGAKNVPLHSVVKKENPSDNYSIFLSKEQLQKLFADNAIDLSKPTICTCYSAITAPAVALALHLAGSKNYSVYGGSWLEWGSQPEDKCPAVVEKKNEPLLVPSVHSSID